MGATSKTGKFAVGFAAVGFVMVLIAFVSPYWLQTDGKLSDPKFTNLGEANIVYIFTTPKKKREIC